MTGSGLWMPIKNLKESGSERWRKWFCFFPAFSSIFSQFKESKASFDSQRRRRLTRDKVKSFFRTHSEARRSRRLTEQARKTFYSNRKRWSTQSWNKPGQRYHRILPQSWEILHKVSGRLNIWNSYAFRMIRMEVILGRRQAPLINSAGSSIKSTFARLQPCVSLCTCAKTDTRGPQSEQCRDHWRRLGKEEEAKGSRR